MNDNNTRLHKGWKNQQTCNVAMWISNDETLYRVALGSLNYIQFAVAVTAFKIPAPDGIRWDDETLDIESLDAFIGSIKY